MTLDVVGLPTQPRRARLGRKATVFLVVVAALAAGLVGYLSHYGLCDFRSKFCVVDVANTRSEVGFEWDSWTLYVSTYATDPTAPIG